MVHRVYHVECRVQTVLVGHCTPWTCLCDTALANLTSDAAEDDDNAWLICLGGRLRNGVHETRS
jgi:hypothetical protein